MRSEEESAPALTPAELRQRALSGVALVGLRGIALRGLGLAGNIVLARLLTPSDFGLVAFGLAFTAFGAFVASGGLAAALIRQAEEPRPAELRAILGLQLLLTAIALVTIAAVAAAVGTAGKVTLVIAASLPFDVLRTVPSVLLERRLLYRPLVRSEIAETVAFQAWAIGTVAAGAGVWGLASASVIRALVGWLVLIRAAPGLMVMPSTNLRPARRLLRFGVLYQAAGITTLVRDQGVNLLIAGIGGVAMLGLWNLAQRLLQAIMLFFSSIWRVSFPAMSRLIETGDDPRPSLSRGLVLASAATGLVLAPLAASAEPLVVQLFGAQWRSAATILPYAALGLLVAGPISVAAAGYLYAVGKASTILIGLVVPTIVWWAVIVLALDPVGAAALGIAALASSLVEAVILGRGLRRAAGIRPLPEVIVPALAAVAAGAVGLEVSSRLGATPAGLFSSAAAALLVYAAALALAKPGLLADLFGVARSAVQRR